ncbi:MAG TPA: cytochrome C oxidase subunit IV family protein [Gemmatimonadales bacterium]
MDSHAAHAPEAQGLDPHEKSHPGPGVYIKIGVVLFVLTALEVAAYEVAHRPGSLGTLLQPILVPVLLLLSAAKFALVAMYYMHLKQDSKLFSGLFVFPLIIAAVVIVSLIALFIYHYSYQRGML